ncbi:MAG: deoxynucleoside kinase, partial [Cetobacterium sp.]
DFLFAKMHLKNGFMTQDEFLLYEAFWKKLISARENPLLIIYLETNVENAIKKINERGRDFEMGVEREYWNSLNLEYSNFFKTHCNSVLLKINIDNMDIRDNEKDRTLFFEMVKSKLKEISF